jgi:hypothetical protein
MVVFGGHNELSGDLDDTWELTLGEPPVWTELAPSGTPPSFPTYHTAIYDPVRQRMIVFGGRRASLYSYGVHALSLGDAPAWSLLSPSGTPPSARACHVAVYDPVRDRMVVFGGQTSAIAVVNDTWALSLAGTPAWSQLAPSGTPPCWRQGHSAIYDPVRDRMIVFGGSDSTSFPPCNDTWELSLVGTPAWTELNPSGALPPGRAWHVAIYDPVRGRLVTYGGWTEAHDDRYDTWALTWGTSGVAEREEQRSLDVTLHPACPNPARGRAHIRFGLPTAGPARLAIYDVAGRLVRCLVDGPVPAGNQELEWDGKDDQGGSVAPGVYYLRLEAGAESLLQKMVMVR